MKRIVFTGGGTLGHVMPNLYLIEDIKNDYECFYIGSNGIEKNKVKDVVKYFDIFMTTDFSEENRHQKRICELDE